jgi:hypothetical protein
MPYSSLWGRCGHACAHSHAYHTITARYRQRSYSALWQAPTVWQQPGEGGGLGTDIGGEGCAVTHMHNHQGWLRGQDVVNPYSNPYSMHALTDLSPRVWGLRVCSHLDDYEGRQAGGQARCGSPHRCTTPMQACVKVRRWLPQLICDGVAQRWCNSSIDHTKKGSESKAATSSILVLC